MELRKAELKEHSTQPPGRFSEGTLVKELEALGIGRPSTYSSIIRLLQVRNAVTCQTVSSVNLLCSATQ